MAQQGTIHEIVKRFQWLPMIGMGGIHALFLNGNPVGAVKPITLYAAIDQDGQLLSTHETLIEAQKQVEKAAKQLPTHADGTPKKILRRIRLS